MSERLVGVVEAVEEPGDDAAALAARAARVKAVGKGESTWGEHAFGPHDLCRVGKTWRGIGIKSHAYRQGFYHMLSGLDASVEGACAYFRQLQDAVEPVPWLSMTAGQWSIEEAEFCFYAAFSQVDVRLRVRAPGNVTQFVLGVDGTTMGCSEELWLEARLCSILRSLELARLGPAQVLRSWTVPSCLRVWDPLPIRGGFAAEQEFLCLAARFYFRSSDGRPVGRWSIASASPLHDAITAYFCDVARYADGAAFFAKLRKDDPEALVGQATCLACGGDEVGARKILRRALAEARRSTTDEDLANQDAPMQENDRLTERDVVRMRSHAVARANGRLAICLGGWARYHLRHENLHRALGCAVRSIEYGGGDDVEAWLLLARVLLAGDEYELAMLALNNAPLAHGGAEDEPAGMASTIGMDPVSCTVRTTDPAGVEENLIMSELQTIRDERESAKGVGKATLGALKAPQLSATKRRAYAVLVDMLHMLGWEPLLELRAGVFLVDGASSSDSELETDMESDAASNTPLGVEQGLDEEDIGLFDDPSGEAGIVAAATTTSNSNGHDFYSGALSSSGGSDGDDELSDFEQGSESDCDYEARQRSRRRRRRGQHRSIGRASTPSEREAHSTGRIDDMSPRMASYYCRHAREPDLSRWYSFTKVSSTERRTGFEDDDDKGQADMDNDADGPALSSVEQLEELLAAHAPQTKLSGQLPSKRRKQYSSPWLEQLFRCLHQDLVALTEWHATAKLTQSAKMGSDDTDDIDEQARALIDGPNHDPESIAGKDSLSESSALSAQQNAYYTSSERRPLEGDDGVELERPPLRERTRSRPTVDWLRLGELAERLDSLDDAVRAYSHAIKALPTSYIALRRLLLLYTSCGRLAEALIAADDLCHYLGEQEPVAVVVACVAQLLDEHGPDELRLVMEEEVGQLHSAVGSAIVEAVARVSGVDLQNRAEEDDEQEGDEENEEHIDESTSSGDDVAEDEDDGEEKDEENSEVHVARGTR